MVKLQPVLSNYLSEENVERLQDYLNNRMEDELDEAIDDFYDVGPFDAATEPGDIFVQVEVAPDMLNDTSTQIAAAQRLHRANHGNKAVYHAGVIVDDNGTCVEMGDEGAHTGSVSEFGSPAIIYRAASHRLRRKIAAQANRFLESHTLYPSYASMFAMGFRDTTYGPKARHAIENLQHNARSEKLACSSMVVAAITLAALEVAKQHQDQAGVILGSLYDPRAVTPTKLHEILEDSKQFKRLGRIGKWGHKGRAERFGSEASTLSWIDTASSASTASTVSVESMGSFRGYRSE